MAAIEVRRRQGGAWCVMIDGQFVSDHATHEAARLTAQRHAALVHDCPTCGAVRGQAGFRGRRWGCTDDWHDR